MTVVCITNFMPEVRSCTVRDEHEDDCDGFEYAWIPKRHREEATGRECKGCAPRPAETGFLCGHCFKQATSALAGYPQLLHDLRGVERAVAKEGGGSSSAGPSVPLSGVDLTLEELGSYHRSLAGRTPEQWVSEQKGARDAVQFGKAFAAAVRAHPTKEAPHRMRHTVCPECRQPTLIWNPPVVFTGNVRIRCRNPACDYSTDQANFEALAEPAPSERTTP